MNTLLSFIKNNENWIELLKAEPYYLKVKQCPFTNKDGTLKYPELYMLSYNQLASDFSTEIVKTSRGTVISVEDPNNSKIVELAFLKFFNYGEPNAAEIDWNTAVVRDKIDGCLLKLFNYKGEWIWITNNGWNITSELPQTLVSSFKEPETESFTTFLELKDYALKKILGNKRLEDFLDKDYTYMFELISPQNRILCDYPETDLYLLGARNMKTFEEKLPEQLKEMFEILVNFKHPKIFDLHNINDVIALCNSYKDSQYEGVVACDANFQRFKIKCAHYLEMKGFRGEVGFTDKKIYNAIRNETVDDILGTFPEIIDKYYQVRDLTLSFEKEVKNLIEIGRKQYNLIEDVNPRKIYADWVISNYSKYKNYLFAALREDEYIERMLNETSYENMMIFLENIKKEQNDD